MTIFDQEYAVKCYIEEVRQKVQQEGWMQAWKEGWQRGWEEGQRNAARKISLNLATMGFSVEQIASAVKESVTDVKKWLEDGNAMVK